MVRERLKTQAKGLGRWVRDNAWLFSVLALAAQAAAVLYNQGQIAGTISRRLDNIETTVGRIEKTMVSQDLVNGLLREAEVTHTALRQSVEVERQQRISDVDGLRALVAQRLRD